MGGIHIFIFAGNNAINFIDELGLEYEWMPSYWFEAMDERKEDKLSSIVAFDKYDVMTPEYRKALLEHSKYKRSEANAWLKYLEKKRRWEDCLSLRFAWRPHFSEKENGKDWKLIDEDKLVAPACRSVQAILVCDEGCADEYEIFSDRDKYPRLPVSVHVITDYNGTKVGFDGLKDEPLDRPMAGHTLSMKGFTRRLSTMIFNEGRETLFGDNLAVKLEVGKNGHAIDYKIMVQQIEE
jgi:hypothetical protein